MLTIPLRCFILIISRRGSGFSLDIMSIKQEKKMKIIDCHAVKSTNEFNGRTYINLIGKDASFAGDRSYKIWTNGDGKISFEKGKGTLSPKFKASLDALKDLHEKGVFNNRSQAEINYDNLQNEGGEGFNPYR